MITLAALTPLVVPVLGLVANFFLKNFNELEMNKWSLAYVVVCNGIFYGLWARLDAWLA